MVLQPELEKKEKPKQPQREWKTVEDVMVRIEREIVTRKDQWDKSYKTTNGYRLTFIDNHTTKQMEVRFERIYISDLLHDFGHILLALTNDEHHLSVEI